MEEYTQVSQEDLRKIKYEFTNSDINFYKKNEDDFVKTEIGDDYKDKHKTIFTESHEDFAVRESELNSTQKIKEPIERRGYSIVVQGIPYYVLTSDIEKLNKYIEIKEQEKKEQEKREREENELKRQQEIKENELKRQQEIKENELKRQQYELERQKEIKEIKQQIIEIIEKSITDSSILQRQSKEKFINKLQEVDDNSIDPKQKFFKNFSNFFKRFDEINNLTIWSTDKLKNKYDLINTVKTDDLKISMNTSDNSLYRIKIEVPHVIFVHDYTDESNPKLSLTQMEIGKEYDMKTSYSTIDLPGVYNHFNQSISHCRVEIKTYPVILGDVLYKFDVYDDFIDVDKFIRIIKNSLYDEKFRPHKKKDAISSLESANKKFFYIYEIDEFEEESNLLQIDEKIAKVIKNRANLKKMKECDVKLYDNDYKLIKKSKYSELHLRTTLHVKSEDIERLKTCLPVMPRVKIFVKDCVKGICRAFSRKVVVPDTNTANEPTGNKMVHAGGKRTRKNKKTRKHKNKKVFRKIKSFRKIRKR